MSDNNNLIDGIQLHIDYPEGVSGGIEFPTHASIPIKQQELYGGIYTIVILDESNNKVVPSYCEFVEFWDLNKVDPRWAHIHFIAKTGGKYRALAASHAEYSEASQSWGKIETINTSSLLEVNTGKITAKFDKSSSSLSQLELTQMNNPKLFQEDKYSKIGVDTSSSQWGTAYLSTDQNATLDIEVSHPNYVVIKCKGIPKFSENQILLQNRGKRSLVSVTTRYHFWADCDTVFISQNWNFDVSPQQESNKIDKSSIEAAYINFPFKNISECNFLVKTEDESVETVQSIKQVDALNSSIFFQHKFNKYIAGKDNDIAILSKKSDFSNVLINPNLNRQKIKFAESNEQSGNSLNCWSVNGNVVGANEYSAQFFLVNGWQEYPFEVKVANDEVRLYMQPEHGFDGFKRFDKLIEILADNEDLSRFIKDHLLNLIPEGNDWPNEASANDHTKVKQNIDFQDLPDWLNREDFSGPTSNDYFKLSSDDYENDKYKLHFEKAANATEDAPERGLKRIIISNGNDSTWAEFFDSIKEFFAELLKMKDSHINETLTFELSKEYREILKNPIVYYYLKHFTKGKSPELKGCLIRCPKDSNENCKKVLENEKYVNIRWKIEKQELEYFSYLLDNSNRQEGKVIRQDVYIKINNQSPTTDSLESLNVVLQNKPVALPTSTYIQHTLVFPELSFGIEKWGEGANESLSQLVHRFGADRIIGQSDASRGERYGRLRYGSYSEQWNDAADRPSYYRPEGGESHYDIPTIHYMYYMMCDVPYNRIINSLSNGSNNLVRGRDKDLLEICRRFAKYCQTNILVNYHSNEDKFLGRWHKGTIPGIEEGEWGGGGEHILNFRVHKLAWLIDADLNQKEAYNRICNHWNFITNSVNQNQHSMLKESQSKKYFLNSRWAKYAVEAGYDYMARLPHLNSAQYTSETGEKIVRSYLGDFWGPLAMREYGKSHNIGFVNDYYSKVDEEDETNIEKNFLNEYFEAGFNEKYLLFTYLYDDDSANEALETLLSRVINLYLIPNRSTDTENEISFINKEINATASILYKIIIYGHLFRNIVDSYKLFTQSLFYPVQHNPGTDPYVHRAHYRTTYILNENFQSTRVARPQSGSDMKLLFFKENMNNAVKINLRNCDYRNKDVNGDGVFEKVSVHHERIDDKNFADTDDEGTPYIEHDTNEGIKGYTFNLYNFYNANHNTDDIEGTNEHRVLRPKSRELRLDKLYKLMIESDSGEYVKKKFSINNIGWMERLVKVDVNENIVNEYMEMLRYSDGKKYSEPGYTNSFKHRSFGTIYYLYIPKDIKFHDIISNETSDAALTEEEQKQRFKFAIFKIKTPVSDLTEEIIFKLRFNIPSEDTSTDKFELMLGGEQNVEQGFISDLTDEERTLKEGKYVCFFSQNIDFVIDYVNQPSEDKRTPNIESPKLFVRLSDFQNFENPSLTSPVSSTDVD